MSKKPENNFIQFTIDHLDPKGQGVFKSADQIYFIAKSLIGEKGEAKIYKTHKNLSFASAQIITQPSESRMLSPCPHYSDCGGCHFLHTDYQTELQAKEATLKFLFKNLPPKEWHSRGASSRLAYRNRVQLHYDLSIRQMGLVSLDQRSILPIPNCLILHPKVAEKMQALYQNETWVNLVKEKNQPHQGHLEIYLKDNEVHVALNSPYGHLGFTQVHEEMNQLLLETIKSEFALVDNKPHLLLDLFGGNGNLSKDLEVKESIVVDYFKDKLPQGKAHQRFLDLDLYEGNAPKLLQNIVQKESVFMLLDPPRSGLKNIDQFLTILKPRDLFYVSCDPHTLKRDLLKIASQYELEKLFLLDLFPSTYHFETLAILRRLES